HQVHDELEEALLADGEAARGRVDEVGQAHAREPIVAARLPAVDPSPHSRDGEVLVHGQLTEELDGLERPAHAPAGDLVGGEPVDAPTVVEYLGRLRAV